MSKREASFYIVDILVAVFRIGQYTKGLESAEVLSRDTMRWDAILRQLEIVGEATKHLIGMQYLDNVQYRKIVDFRNIIAHGYFGIDEEEVWYVVRHKIETFKNELLQLVREREIDLQDAINSVIEENHQENALIAFFSAIY